MHLGLRATGRRCAAARITVQVVADGRALQRSTRVAADALGEGRWVGFAVAGDRLKAGAGLDVSATVTGDCAVEIATVASVDGTPQPALQLLTDDPSDGVRIASTELAWIYERPTAQPMVRANGMWKAFPDQASLLADLASTTAAGDGPLVARYVGAARAGSTGAEVALDHTVFGNDVVRVGTTSSGPSLVTVAQDAADGWQASIDGRSAAVVKVDGTLLGVFVPAGHHEVRFMYAPATFRVGLLVSALAVLVALVALALTAPAVRRWRATTNTRWLGGRTIPTEVVPE